MAGQENQESAAMMGELLDTTYVRHKYLHEGE